MHQGRRGEDGYARHALIGIDGSILNLEGMFKFKFDFDIAGGLEEKNSGIIQSSLGAAHI